MFLKLSYIGSIGNGKWRVYSELGKNLGTFSSYFDAKKHLKEIEMFKHMKKNKRKLAYNQIINLIKQAEETVVTYSSTMRQLRKENPEKLTLFMKAFKKAFDEGIKNGIEEDLEQISLLEALQNS